MPHMRHHPIPPIYLCYSNQGEFLERYFAVQLHERLLQRGLGDGVLWFDHRQGIHADRSATWLADRLEAIDLSLGSVVIGSSSWQHQRLMLVESQALVERKTHSKPTAAYRLILVLLGQCDNFARLRAEADALHVCEHVHSISSVDAQITSIVDDVLKALLPFKACSFIRNTLATKPEQSKPLCTWSPEDIHSYLSRLGIGAASRQLFLKHRIDGYLLLSCTENELKEYFLVDDAQVRQGLIEHVIQTVHDECASTLQWHWVARKNKGSPGFVYLIYHPEDAAIAGQISQFLKEKNFQVLTHHPRYAKSKEQFLALNGPSIARTSHVVYVLTKKSLCSVFPLLEVTVAEWFEKSIVTAAVECVWSNTRPTLRALLGSHPMVNFVDQPMPEGLASLCTHLSSPKTNSQRPVVDHDLQQKELVESSVCLETTPDFGLSTVGLLPANEVNSPLIYLSYSRTNEKWNGLHMIERLIETLKRHQFRTGIEMKSINTGQGNLARSIPKSELKSSSLTLSVSYLRPFDQSTIADFRHHLGPGDIRHCSLVIICLTPNYFFNEHCLNELRLCEAYQKPVVVCLVKRMSSSCWRPTLNAGTNVDEQLNLLATNRLSMTTLQFLRRNLRVACVDLTTDDLFSRNIPTLLQRLETIRGSDANAIDDVNESTSSKVFEYTSEVF